MGPGQARRPGLQESPGDDHDSPVEPERLRTEIFGPVLAVLPYDTIDQAIEMANDSDYGLGGTVWTADEQRGIEIARRIQTGSIGINHYDLDINAPFGGVKASGIGRELGPEGLRPYLSYKSIYLAAAGSVL